MAFWARVETRGYIPLVSRKCKVYSPVSNRKWKLIGRKAVRKLSGCNLFEYLQKLGRSVFAFSALTEITYIQHNRNTYRQQWKYKQPTWKYFKKHMCSLCLCIVLSVSAGLRETYRHIGNSYSQHTNTIEAYLQSIFCCIVPFGRAGCWETTSLVISPPSPL